MHYVILADCVVIVHVAFVLFVTFGGFLGLRWRSLLWLHFPAAAWGLFIECTGGTCPLTPLEKRLRVERGGRVYGGLYLSLSFGNTLPRGSYP